MREVQLFDENGERRDRFSTKPADKGQKTSTAEGVARASGIAFAEKGDTYFLDGVAETFPQIRS